MRLLALGAFALMLAAPVSGQQGEEAAVREVVRKYMDARDRRDAQALEALFTTDADQHTTGGEWRRGRASVVPGSLGSSERNPGERAIRVESVRFVTPDVAIADGPYEITSAAGVRRMWTTIILARVPGGWRIAAIRNMAPTTAAAR